MHQVTCIGINETEQVILWYCTSCGWTGKSNPVTGWSQGLDDDHTITAVPSTLEPDEWAKLGVEGMGHAYFEIEFYCPSCETSGRLTLVGRFQLAPGSSLYACPTCGAEHEVVVEYKRVETEE